MQLSVLMAVRDGARHVEAALESVLTQLPSDAEVIVVDDGSRDATPELLARAVAADARVRVAQQPARGLAAALNHGLSLARAPLVARQDADDLSRPGRLAAQVAVMTARPELAALGTSADVIDENGQPAGTLRAATGPDAVRAGLLSLRTTPVHGSMLLRREMVAAVGGYREAFRYGQDYDLWLRLVERYPIDNVPETYYQWRLDAGGVYRTRRARQLQYAAIARQFAEQRSAGADEYDTLARCDGDPDQFVLASRDAGAIRARWAELWLRGMGNSADVRREFRRAVARGALNMRTLGLALWTHAGLPWPGGAPLRATDA